jgi:hypothetical protein
VYYIQQKYLPAALRSGATFLDRIGTGTSLPSGPGTYVAIPSEDSQEGNLHWLFISIGVVGGGVLFVIVISIFAWLRRRDRRNYIKIPDYVNHAIDFNIQSRHRSIAG